MKREIILIIISFSIISISAQEVCCFMSDSIIENNQLQQIPYLPSVCSNKENYTIYPDYFMTPQKTIRVSFDVIQKSDGSGSYLGTENQITDFFRKLIDAANQYMSNLPVHIPNVSSNYIIDSRIRFVLNKVFFLKNDDVYNTTYGSSDASNASLIYNNYILTQNDLNEIDKHHTLHVIMEPLLPGRTVGGQASGIGDRQWIVMRGYEQSYNDELTNTGNYINTANYFAYHFIHEAGHSMGLYHTFSCNDCNDYGCHSAGTTNNFMDYPNWINHNQTYCSALTECQISKIHYSLMGYFGSIKEDLIQDFCIFDDNQSFHIDNGREINWLNLRNLRGNLSIFGKLTLKCSLSLPQGAGIFIQNSGLMNLEEGLLKNACSNDWNGIIVKSGGLLILNSTSIADYNVTVECGGSVIIKGGLIISGEHSLQVFSGGYFCFDNNPIISLTDYLSLIKINEGAINGINPLLSGISTNCGTIPTHTGNGAFADFNQDV